MERCVCGLDSPPDFDGRWVECDSCGVWSHAQCTGVGFSRLVQQDTFFCYVCSRRVGCDRSARREANERIGKRRREEREKDFSETECPICSEEFGRSGEGKRVSCTLGCGHKMHLLCLSSSLEKVSPTCPVCRSGVDRTKWRVEVDRPPKKMGTQY